MALYSIESWLTQDFEMKAVLN
jgi:hypothetical protein